MFRLRSSSINSELNAERSEREAGDTRTHGPLKEFVKDFSRSGPALAALVTLPARFDGAILPAAFAGALVCGSRFLSGDFLTGAADLATVPRRRAGDRLKVSRLLPRGSSVRGGSVKPGPQVLPVR
jgi:hypothetical protein